MLKGMPIIYFKKTETGKDDFNRTIYEEVEEVVEDVLIYPNGTNDIPTATDLTGKKVTYILAIPKGDEHDWENAKVSFFGHIWKTYGFPIEGIESMLPLRWNKKVMVELYE
jgi:hypothetical protein